MKKQFNFHVIKTRHYEFTLYAEDADAARLKGMDIWRKAPTTGQWELPETETEYEIKELSQDQQTK